jgi:hypothetical protein
LSPVRRRRWLRSWRRWLPEGTGATFSSRAVHRSWRTASTSRALRSAAWIASASSVVSPPIHSRPKSRREYAGDSDSQVTVHGGSRSRAWTEFTDPEAAAGKTGQGTALWPRKYEARLLAALRRGSAAQRSTLTLRRSQARAGVYIPGCRRPVLQSLRELGWQITPKPVTTSLKSCPPALPSGALTSPSGATTALYEPAIGTPERATFVLAHGAGGHMHDSGLLRTMHWLEGADRSFHVLRSSGRSGSGVMNDVGTRTSTWLPELAQAQS